MALVLGFRQDWDLPGKGQKLPDLLGMGPKIKKLESMVFDHTPLTPYPPFPNYGLFTQNFFPLFIFNVNMI